MPNLTREQKRAMLQELRRAVLFQAKRWDAESRMEDIAGVDLEGETWIKHLASNVSLSPGPHGADFIKLEYVDEFLQEASRE